MADVIVIAKPCKKCGATERYADGHCKACARAGASIWSKANPDKAKAIRLKWAIANPEKVAAKDAAWRKANPEKQAAYEATYRMAHKEKLIAKGAAYKKANAEKIKLQRAAYRKDHPDKVKASQAAYTKSHLDAMRIKNHNRRAKIQSVGGKLSKDIAIKLFKLQRGKCACCRLPLGDDYHLDHRMPLALGGENVDSNMQLLRATCNVHKSAKHPTDFMQSRGFLL